MNWRFSSLLPVDLKSYLISPDQQTDSAATNGRGSGLAHGAGLAQGSGLAQGLGLAQLPGLAQGLGLAQGPGVSQSNALRMGVPFSIGFYQPMATNAAGG